MPLYAYICVSCREEAEGYASVEDRRLQAPECRVCGEKMDIKITAPMIAPDIEPYVSKIDGREITSRRQHRNHLAENHCEEVGNEMPGWMKEKKYIESHGGTWTPPIPPEPEGVRFEWQDGPE